MLFGDYSFRGLESMAIMVGTRQQAGKHGAGAVHESLYPETQREKERERQRQRERQREREREGGRERLTEPTNSIE